MYLKAKAKNKQFIYSSIIIVVGYFLLTYPFFKGNKVWGDEPDEPYITITGSKPEDAKVTSWAAFTVSGDECERYSYDLFGRESHRGGKFDQSFTHDFSTTKERYELRIQYYPSVYDDDHCITELRDFKVKFRNKFGGFGSFKGYQSGEENYNKPIPTDSIIESKDCNAEIHHDKLGWFGAIICELFVNGKSKLNDTRFADAAFFDFSKFTDTTVIEYNVYAGDNYLTTPLDKKLGPSESEKKAVVDW